MVGRTPRRQPGSRDVTLKPNAAFAAKLVLVALSFPVGLIVAVELPTVVVLTLVKHYKFADPEVVEDLTALALLVLCGVALVLPFIWIARICKRTSERHDLKVSPRLLNIPLINTRLISRALREKYVRS